MGIEKERYFLPLHFLYFSPFPLFPHYDYLVLKLLFFFKLTKGICILAVPCEEGPVLAWPLSAPPRGPEGQCPLGSRVPTSHCINSYLIFVTSMSAMLVEKNFSRLELLVGKMTGMVRGEGGGLQYQMDSK